MSEEVTAPVVAGVDFAAALAAICGLIVGIGLERVYVHTLGALLQGIAKAGKIGVWRIHINVGGPADALNHRITRELGAWILANEQVLGLWLHANKVLLEWTYDGIVGFGHAVHGAIDGLIHGAIPQAIGDVFTPVKTDLGKLRAFLRSEVQRLTRDLVRKAHALELEIEHTFGRAWRGIEHIRTKDLPRALAWITATAAAIAALRHYVFRVLNRRITRLERLLGAGFLTAVVLHVLARVMPWYKCSNVKRTMRGICRADPSWIGLLFGAGVEAFVIADLCDFIGALARASRAVQPALVAFASAEDALINCPYASYPAKLPAYGIALPRAQRRAALPVEAV